MLQVHKDFGLSQFEQGLTSLAGGETVLSLPNSIRAEAVGATSAAIQLVTTWARGPSPTLRLHADDLSDAAFQAFAATPFGLAALNGAHRIESRRGEELSRYEALMHAKAYIQAMDSGSLRDIRQANAIALLCLDNARYLGRRQRLYSPSGQVRSVSDIADLLTACFGALPIPDARRSGIDRMKDDAAAILYEAFLNTHDHALKDISGNDIGRSTRGALIGWRYIDRDVMARAAEGHEVLKSYFLERAASLGISKHDQFAELSVFDSGVGLAQTWLRSKSGLHRPIVEAGVSVDVELEAVDACLTKGATTKVNRLAGIGLFRILKLTGALGGFVRIRTGRLSLARAFSRPVMFKPEDVWMVDAEDGGKPSGDRAWAEGTVLTLVLPLDRSWGPQ